MQLIGYKQLNNVNNLNPRHVESIRWRRAGILHSDSWVITMASGQKFALDAGHDVDLAIDGIRKRMQEG